MTPFTDAQLRKVYAIIRAYHAAVIISTLGVKGPLTDEEVAKLRRLGLVNDRLRKPLQDAYLFGRLQKIMKDPAAKGMSFKRFMEFLKTYHTPLTPTEKEAIRYASSTAAAHIRDLGYSVDRRVGETLAEASRRYTASLVGLVRSSATEAIAKRQTVKALADHLRRQTQDFKRDFLKIAATEKHNAFQQGVARVMEKDHGADAEVIKIPRPNACPYCKRVFLHADGSPKVFKLKDLMGKSNVGKAKARWGPVLDSVHPFCSCQLVRVPKGWGWDRKLNRLTPQGAPLKKGDPRALIGQCRTPHVPVALEFQASFNKKAGLWEYQLKGDSPCPQKSPSSASRLRRLSVISTALTNSRNASSR